MTENQTQPLDGGQVTVRPEFLAVLRANGLETFEKIMAHARGSVMRSVPGRSTVRIELNQAEGTMVAFLKRYESQYVSFGRKLLRFFRWPGACDEALHEWNAIEQLRDHGFNTAIPIAVGQQKRMGVVVRSFLMTAEIVGGVAAHEFVRTLQPTTRRALVQRIAELTQRFHGAGFAHRDYYLSHIFVRPPQPSARNPELVFIDLQRLFRPRWFQDRWLVKDLAALGYSAQLSGATRTDLLSFYKTCLMRSRLQAQDRRLIRTIMARITALHGRAPKYDVIWDQPGVRPRNV
jgi:hypothetical protein